MKEEVTYYMAKCLTCHRVKIKHQRHTGLLQPLALLSGNKTQFSWILGWLTTHTEKD